MRAAGEVAAKAVKAPQQFSGEKPKPQPALPQRWTEAIFAKFAARYTHKWTSAFPTKLALDAAKAEWGQRLSGLTGDEIKRGLDAWKGDWPPSTEEFVKACKPATEELENADMYREAPKALPEPKEAREARRAKGKAAAQMLKSHVRRITGRQNEMEESQ